MRQPKTDTIFIGKANMLYKEINIKKRCQQIKWQEVTVNIITHVQQNMGFPSSSVVKNPPASVGDVGLTPGLGRSPREGNDKPL